MSRKEMKGASSMEWNSEIYKKLLSVFVPVLYAVL